ncbi:hypothetical protein [Pedobacter sp. SYSU D00535]|uniref:hypothetical protein n=1 Tax=Pedobacter sp. SYSU D00535 TaxID=2810308 RepID=UPI001A965BD8|nr:hypothetical protein [Pedobacter sp. SYSU D00535]
MEKSFEVKILFNNSETSVQVDHRDETFELMLPDGQQVSILNNGDNTWQLVSGNLSQEQVNLIGDAIEKYYQQSPL